MINDLERKKLRKEAIQLYELSNDLKQSAVDLVLKSIKSALQKHKHIELIVLRGQIK
jgi:nucleoid DNA-binding protein